MSEIYVIDQALLQKKLHLMKVDSGKVVIFYIDGKSQIYNRGSNADQILDDQHSVNWIPDGYPGEGNLIVFNNRHNGNQSAGWNLSRLL